MLNEMQGEAEAVLLKLFRSHNPRHRARALWLLTKISGRGGRYVEVAIQDQDEDIRIVGLRAARQLKMNMIPLATGWRSVGSSSPRMRPRAASQSVAARPRRVGGTGGEA